MRTLLYKRAYTPNMAEVLGVARAGAHYAPEAAHAVGEGAADAAKGGLLRRGWNAVSRAADSTAGRTLAGAGTGMGVHALYNTAGGDDKYGPWPWIAGGAAIGLGSRPTTMLGNAMGRSSVAPVRWAGKVPWAAGHLMEGVAHPLTAGIGGTIAYPLYGNTKYNKGQAAGLEEGQLVRDATQASLDAANLKLQGLDPAAPNYKYKSKPPPETTGGAFSTLSDAYNAVPNWGKVLGLGGAALGGGYMLDRLTGNRDKDEEDSGMPGVGTLVGLGGLGAGLGAMSDWDYGKLLQPNWWQSKTAQVRVPLSMYKHAVNPDPLTLPKLPGTEAPGVTPKPYPSQPTPPSGPPRMSLAPGVEYPGQHLPWSTEHKPAVTGEVTAGPGHVNVSQVANMSPGQLMRLVKDPQQSEWAYRGGGAGQVSTPPPDVAYGDNPPPGPISNPDTSEGAMPWAPGSAGAGGMGWRAGKGPGSAAMNTPLPPGMTPGTETTGGMGPLAQKVVNQHFQGDPNAAQQAGLERLKQMASQHAPPGSNIWEWIKGVWNGMTKDQRVMLGVGLGLGAVGLMGMMGGGGGGKGGGGGMMGGMLGPLLGIGGLAAAGYAGYQGYKNYMDQSGGLNAPRGAPATPGAPGTPPVPGAPTQPGAPPANPNAAPGAPGTPGASGAHGALGATPPDLNKEIAGLSQNPEFAGYFSNGQPNVNAIGRAAFMNPDSLKPLAAQLSMPLRQELARQAAATPNDDSMTVRAKANILQILNEAPPPPAPVAPPEAPGGTPEGPTAPQVPPEEMNQLYSRDLKGQGFQDFMQAARTMPPDQLLAQMPLSKIDDISQQLAVARRTVQDPAQQQRLDTLANRLKELQAMRFEQFGNSMHPGSGQNSLRRQMAYLGPQQERADIQAAEASGNPGASSLFNQQDILRNRAAKLQKLYGMKPGNMTAGELSEYNQAATAPTGSAEWANMAKNLASAPPQQIVKSLADAAGQGKDVDAVLGNMPDDAVKRIQDSAWITMQNTSSMFGSSSVSPLYKHIYDRAIAILQARQGAFPQ